EVDYDVRQSVTDLAAAVLPDAPQIWPQAPGNIAIDWPGFADDAAAREEREKIFADAAHVARVRLVNQRIVMAPMEPRAALACYDAESGRYVLPCAAQSAFVMGQPLAECLGEPIEKVRVISGDVGGAF